MTANVETQQIYANRRNNAHITCPSCSKTRVVNVGKYRNIDSPVKVKCSCGFVFQIPRISRESRKFYRKKTNLSGSYSNTETNKKGIIVVKEIDEKLEFALSALKPQTNIQCYSYNVQFSLTPASI